MTAARLAEWCIATGQPPDVYHSLTRLERDAFVTAVNQTRR